MSKAAERKIERAVATATAKVIKAVSDKLTGTKQAARKKAKAKKVAKKKK